MHSLTRLEVWQTDLAVMGMLVERKRSISYAQANSTALKIRYSWIGYSSLVA